MKAKWKQTISIKQFNTANNVIKPRKTTGYNREMLWDKWKTDIMDAFHAVTVQDSFLNPYNRQKHPPFSPYCLWLWKRLLENIKYLFISGLYCHFPLVFVYLLPYSSIQCAIIITQRRWVRGGKSDCWIWLHKTSRALHHLSAFCLFHSEKGYKHTRSD